MQGAVLRDDWEIDHPASSRFHVIPSRTRSQPSSRRVAPTLGYDADPGNGELEEAVGRELGNGDLYTGTLFGGVPHGVGMYMWSDGCKYDGQWWKGKANGEGKFSWPSGATYNGEFRCGRMDGQGTFVGVDGDAFIGQWMADRKHGYGEKRYANGDFYRGYWKRNLQNGEGVYRWNDGNEYIGGWRNGVIHGKGVLVSENGDRFHGVWDNGIPGGKGYYSASSVCDSSLKHSSSDKVRKEGSYTRKRASADASLPKICIWELDGEAGDITCDIIENVNASEICTVALEWYEEGASAGGGISHRSPCCSSSDVNASGSTVKKPGRVISKGDKNYDLVLNLQVGIRHSVGKHSSSMQELRQSDFDPSEKFWTRFPPEGSKNTPTHSSTEFKWKDYCPVVFRHLRELFAIDAVDYMLAICGSDALREFSSPGKSGSFFYLTQDDRFIIKTIKKSEVKVLTRMLPSYYRHVCRYNNTLITRFLGLHCIRVAGGSKIRFIVMGNLFDSEYPIHKRFDLKGSSHGRTTDKVGEENEEFVTLKDLDFNFTFHLNRTWYQELIRQINRDCEFLETEGIMDYSLLIGIHFCDGNWGSELRTSPQTTQNGDKTLHDETSMRGYHLLPNMDWVMESQAPLIRLGVNMPARAEHVSKAEPDHLSSGGTLKPTNSHGGSYGEIFDVVLFFGIIDILQDYDISKKLEHAYKSLQVDPVSISAVDPKLYSKRFRDFINRIFVEYK